jgi:transcriptional regulator with XRE-family HTH domain
MPGATRIGPRRPRKVYLAEWREHRGLTQKQLGGRLGVTDMTVSRWEKGRALVNTNVLAAIAEALSLEPQDLYRHPDQPSADALLRGQPQDVKEQAFRLIEAIRKAN